MRAASEVEEPAELDEAGDSFVTAAPLGTLAESTLRTGRVGNDDLTDYYEFHLSETTVVEILLFGTQSDAYLGLFDARQQLLSHAADAGASQQTIHQVLTAGDYFVLVLAGDQATPYNLALAPLSDHAVNPETTKPDLGGDAFGRATPLGALTSTITLHDKVGDTDPADVYLVDIKQRQNVSVVLDQLTANVDLHVITRDNQLVARSRNANATSETLNLDLAAGSYFVLVFPIAAKSSDYRLQIQPSVNAPTAPAPTPVTLDAGDTFNRATNVGTVTTWQRAETLGGADTTDVFRFDLAQKGRVRLLLSQLTADIDMYVFDAAFQQVGRDYQPGTSNEVVDVNLAAGSYYVIAIPHGDVTGSYVLQIQANLAPPTPPTVSNSTDLPIPLPDVANYGSSIHWTVNSVQAPEAWAYGFAGKGVVVAVVDSGVDLTHPDLAANVWRNADEIPGDQIDNDGNGFVDDTRGWNFVNGNSNVADLTGHGTHVAGIVASLSDGSGSTGLAFQAKVMPLRVLDANGNGRTSSVADAIRYAVDNGADIVSLSLSSDGYSASIYNALVYAHDHSVLVTVAAGNSGASLPSYPARHSAELANVLSVGAYDSSGQLAGFSNRVGSSGAVQIDAPGVDVYSTQPGGKYGSWYGTSMAAPHAAGLGALILSANPKLSADQVRVAIVQMASRRIVGSDSAGALNAATSVPLAYNTRVTSQALARPEVAGRLPIVESQVAVHAAAQRQQWAVALDEPVRRNRRTASVT